MRSLPSNVSRIGWSVDSELPYAIVFFACLFGYTLWQVWKQVWKG